MAKPVTTKGGLLRILLGNSADPIVYTAPCGLTSKSLTISKNLEEVNIPDCDDPTAIDWLGRDATSLSMAVSGEGVLAQAAVEAWLDAVENPNSVPVKLELEFPTTTWSWTGFMHVESAELGAPSNTGRVTGNFSLQSDGEMVRTSAAT
ncbi:Phage tail tube protein [Devosia crocina]|uniref:Phage tail tube protein n=1 Tax=Devosia crocina TaxID=429728 RepID=A0A1I7NF03_9HYPH|nr:phage tail tube protein [Devosia crocina]SFV33173.1 Phage tail tube protein [Devosia crocina]